MQPITFFAIQLLAFSLASGQAPWDSIPFQEPIPARSLFCLGDRLWVGDDAGLRESRDGGGTWRSLEPLPDPYGVYGLYMSDSFQVMLRSDAIYRSTDFGHAWQQADADPSVLLGNRFRAHGDSLFLESHSTQAGERAVSLDQGKTWFSLGNQLGGENADSLEPAPKYGLRLNGGLLSQSVDGGATWSPAPWQAPLGTPIALAAGSGNAYALSSGLVLRLHGPAETWDVLQPSLQAATPLHLAACGSNLCVATSFAVSCSRDGGRHFQVLGRNPFSAAKQVSTEISSDPDYSIAVDQDRLYLGSLAYNKPSFLWQRGLADSGDWSTLRFSPKDSIADMIPAARQGLLVIITGELSRGVRVSTDQGLSFREMPFPTNVGSFQAAALAKTRWAVVTGTEMYLSSDSGKTWKTLSNRDYQYHHSIALSESTLYTSTNRYDIRDSSWSPISIPGTLLAASDSVLYSSGPGVIWAQRLLADPTTALIRRAKSHQAVSLEAHPVFGLPAEEPMHDALGKRRTYPAR